MAVALVALGARGARPRPGGRTRTIPLGGLHRLPGDEPERDTVLGRGDLITAIELAAAALRRAARRYRKVRDRASFSFAVVSVAAAVDVDDGDGARQPHRLGGRRSRAMAGAARRGARCAARRPRGRALRRAAEAELAQALPLRDNAFKVPLARNLLVRTLAELCEAP